MLTGRWEQKKKKKEIKKNLENVNQRESQGFLNDFTCSPSEVAMEKNDFFFILGHKEMINQKLKKKFLFQGS